MQGLEAGALRVAVVGAGPAGLYAVGELLATPGLQCEIDVIERLPTPWGLVRAGVAPDHPEKKQVAERLFQFHLQHPQVRFFGNVALGRDVQPQQLSSWYDAVIYAIGAAADAPLGITGDDLAGCWSAREFVAWYNGHPDQRDLAIDLSNERAVVVGNGNVALDLARLLLSPLSALAKTDIADHALRVLRGSRVREVVILGRRGCVHSAFHTPELEELGHLPELQISIEGEQLPQQLDNLDWPTRRKLTTLAQLTQRAPKHAGRRLVFRYGATPVALIGSDGRVTQLAVKQHPRDEVSTLATGLVLRAIGYRGTAQPGLPFDEVRGVISNVGGRVVDQGAVVPGAYVTGWIKRGPRGIIGSNKKCATETVRALLQDHAAGTPGAAQRNAAAVRAELLRRQPHLVEHDGWRAIDRAERLAGAPQGRPRIKTVDVAGLLACAVGQSRSHS